MRILIIEDDRVIRKFLTLALKTNHYEVHETDQGILGINILMNMRFDLILLDLGLPDIDGLEAIKQIRDITIIIISARGKEQDKVTALDAGANDYVTKPFNIGEVLARIRVAIRQKSIVELPETFQFKHLFIDFERRKVLIHQNEVHFTPIEFKILELLIKNQGKVLTHSFIQNNIWGYTTVDDYQSLRVFMASIRRKLEDQSQDNPFIQTEVGVGYRFREE
jgi:two-component system KDP operon response regulator KdpE